MKAFYSVTRRFFAEIWSDAMLAALLFIPLVMGAAFRFGVPLLEGYLCKRFAQTAILAPWYVLFDLLLTIMTPVMFTAAGALVILEEADLGLARAISVTPVGRRGYLASRILVPAVLATVYCLIVSFIFRLSTLDGLRRFLLVLASGALSVVVALFVVSMAKNKVEGLAWSKLSGLLVLGLPAAILLPSPQKYALAFLPSFWMTEMAMGKSVLFIFPALVTALLLSMALARRFMKKCLA